MTDKKTIELAKLKAFLKYLGYIIEDFEASENPDAIFTVKRSPQEKPQKLGIEYTDYYSDALPGVASPGKRLYDFWGGITYVLDSKVQEASDLRKICGYFKLNKQELLKRAGNITSPDEGYRLIVAIANEFLDLIKEFSKASVYEREYGAYKRLPESMCPLPSKYTSLNKYFLCIELTKVDWQVDFKYDWHANVNAAHIGLSPERLALIVKEKAEKCHFYSRENIDELWLLISAPATTVYNSMHSHPEFVKWNTRNLISECKSSGFDKMFFWSRKPPEWHRQIWPQSQSIVRP